jgi:hypothetical protein
MGAMGESIWVMPAVSAMVLYVGTVLMSAGTFLAVLAYVFWHKEPEHS